MVVRIDVANRRSVLERLQSTAAAIEQHFAVIEHRVLQRQIGTVQIDQVNVRPGRFPEPAEDRNQISFDVQTLGLAVVQDGHVDIAVRPGVTAHLRSEDDSGRDPAVADKRLVKSFDGPVGAHAVGG